MKKSKINKNAIIYIVGGVLILIATLVSIFFYSQYRKTQKLLQQSNLTASAETRMLIEKVGKLIKLPEDEEPTIATISDKDKLKNQPFFTNAKNGDKVLIYNNAQKAILYDPVDNIIIEVAPISLGSPSATMKEEEQKILAVAVYNGTGSSGLAQKAAQTLEEKVQNIEIIQKDNAKKKYKETTVIDLTGENKDYAVTIATVVKGKTGSLPSAETPPNTLDGKLADILVIIGENFLED